MRDTLDLINLNLQLRFGSRKPKVKKDPPKDSGHTVMSYLPTHREPKIVLYSGERLNLRIED